ncbi:unnamed protein product [Paramecium primaurelia]|uniref:RING-type E3 ubiquitin transferase n=1 Tax=Paramecium primaurelia TaxID=5886 RepID=A0A8S1NJM4_PARPR|nr:unnamed protein product [Paramecium primaurelia]
MGCQIFRSKKKIEEERKQQESLVENQMYIIINDENKSQQQVQVKGRNQQIQNSRLTINNPQSLSIISHSSKKLGYSLQEINIKILPKQTNIDKNIQNYRGVAEMNNNKQVFQNQQQIDVFRVNNNINQQNQQQQNLSQVILLNNTNQQSQQKKQIQEIQQSVPQQQIQQNNKNINSNVQQENEIITPFNEESIFKRCFMIDVNELKIGKLYAQMVKQVNTFTLEIILDQIIPIMINNKQLLQSQTVTWLIQVLVNLSNCDIKSTYAIFEDGVISKEILIILIDAIIDKIVCAVAKPQKLQWQADREEINKYNGLENQIATQVYDMLFGQMIKTNYEISFENLEHPALNYLLTYLDTKCQPEDAFRFLDLITKRELLRCQKVDLLDCVYQLKASLLLDKLSLYPKLTDLLFQNSWAYGKFQIYKFGRDIQQYSIFGSIISLSTFPGDFPHVKLVFGNQEKSLLILQETYRGPIYEIINKMADIFLRIIRRGKEAQLQLFTYIIKLIEINLNLEKLNQTQNINKCCFQGMMFNLQQILLEIFNPFIYNTEQANARLSKINLDLLASVKTHPLFSKIYSNAGLMAPLKTVFIPQDKSPVLDPMTVLYLLIQRIGGLSQRIINNYAHSYVHYQIDKQFFGPYSRITQLSEIEKATFDTLFLHPKSIQNTIQFLSFQSKLALSLLDENYKPKYPYGLLYNQFMQDVPNYCFIYNSNGVALDYLDEVISIVEFTIITMKYQDLIEDIHLRCKGIELFYIFNEYMILYDSKNALMSFKIFSENKIIQNFLIQGLIQSYIDRDRIKMSSILPAIRFKKAICQLFKYALTNHRNIYENKFLEFVNMNSTTYQNFAFVYINDIKEMVDQCVQATKKIKLEEETLANQYSLLNTQEKALKEILRLIEIHRCIVDWEGAIELFNNIILFTKIEPKAFLIEETRQQFAQNLNNVLQQLNGEGNSFLKAKFLVQLQMNPQDISKNIIEIYVNLQDQPLFWDEIIMNNQQLQIQSLYQLVNNMSNQYTISNDLLYKFSQIINNLQQLRNEFNQIMNDLSKDPNLEDRYLDSLTRNLMTDPVMLPNSKQIVDRVTIKRYLIKKQEDPFDRSFLVAEMLIEQKELKLEIKQYMDQKKNQLRQLRGNTQNFYA